MNMMKSANIKRAAKEGQETVVKVTGIRWKVQNTTAAHHRNLYR